MNIFGCDSIENGHHTRKNVKTVYFIYNHKQYKMNTERHLPKRFQNAYSIVIYIIQGNLTY